MKDFKPLKNARTNASTVTIGNNLYVIGGAKDRNRASPLKSVEMYTLDESTPETPTTPEPTPDQSSGDRALLVITMTNGLEKEFDLSMDEVNDFISWYDQKDAGSGSSKYAIDKHDNNKGPFSSRKDYVIFNNILTFEVNEYSSK
ncbi:kelch repeat-containing protein [Bacillus sp. HSf4]|uniref:Kelch repeat-containing protein n=1 Tax=Bacillus sp. HSf4 TaxID=3035514 RepID=UPI0024092299|nr:kelch repeat-containing protein [Bacillus sp. HSf4]WFA07569.1 kelch repeat-containing protein [Bacillus sp. HSf4]